MQRVFQFRHVERQKLHIFVECGTWSDVPIYSTPHWSSIISKLTCSGSTPLVTKVDRSLQASTEVEISISPSWGLANLVVSSDSAKGIKLARSLWSFSDEVVSWTGHSENTVAALLHGSLTASSVQVRRPKSTASASSIRAERWS